jgi:hypothetical protein
VSDFITSVAAGAVNLTFVPGAPPDSSTGPAITASGNTSVVPGGSSQVDILANGLFTTVIVFVQGVDGYYIVEFPSGVLSTTLILTISQTISGSAFDCVYFVGSSGTFGPTEIQNVEVINVGTGEVQVSLSFNRDSDIDLHVVEPSGEEIFYGNTISDTGGMLDLDSNAACFIDGINNENITWETAPSGSYTVRVDNWDSCGQEPINYSVTVNREGQQTLVFTGTFTGAGDNGGLGDGEFVTQFNF